MNIKKGIYILLFFFATYNAVSQESQEIDFIITVDDKIVNAVQGLKIKAENHNGVFYISPSYYPGNLSMDKNSYDKLISKETKSMKITFSYSEERKGNLENYFYEIDYDNKWFNELFNILKIYNLDNRKYRKIYEPSTKNSYYSFSLDFGSYGILNLKKKQ